MNHLIIFLMFLIIFILIVANRWSIMNTQVGGNQQHLKITKKPNLNDPIELNLYLKRMFHIWSTQYSPTNYDDDFGTIVQPYYYPPYETPPYYYDSSIIDRQKQVFA